jgi:predicted DCC family thiol-disulfide oxidoreductase YuxK
MHAADERRPTWHAQASADSVAMLRTLLMVVSAAELWRLWPLDRSLRTVIGLAPLLSCAATLTIAAAAARLGQRPPTSPRDFQRMLMLTAALFALAVAVVVACRIKLGMPVTTAILSPSTLLAVVFIDSAHWSPRYLAPTASGTVFFDGVCGMCNRFVDALLVRDVRHRLRFATLEGVTAAPVLARAAGADSVLYVEGAQQFERSTAALAALSRLGGWWSYIAVLGLVPRPLRDAVYDAVARRRFGWFGVRDSCRQPSPAERAWFLP